MSTKYFDLTPETLFGHYAEIASQYSDRNSLQLLLVNEIRSNSNFVL
jgi:hypothetical protein